MHGLPCLLALSTEGVEAACLGLDTRWCHGDTSPCRAPLTSQETPLLGTDGQVRMDFHHGCSKSWEPLKRGKNQLVFVHVIQSCNDIPPRLTLESCAYLRWLIPLCRSVILSQGWFASPGNIWPLPGDTSDRHDWDEGICWHLGVGDQRCCWTSYNAQGRTNHPQLSCPECDWDTWT